MGQVIKSDKDSGVICG